MIEPKFHFAFLGTGTSGGIPFLRCECSTCKPILKDKNKQKMRMSAIIFLEDGHNILIDCGTDIRKELLKAKVDHIDAVIMTHAHADHMHGLHDLRRFAIAQKQEIPIYCGEDVVKNIDLKFYNDFHNESQEENSEDKKQIHQTKEKMKKYFDIHILYEGVSQEFNLFGLKFTTIPVMHGKLPILGYKFGHYAYITDAKFIPPKGYNVLTDIDVFIINTLEEHLHPTHFSFHDSLEAIAKVHPKIAYLIHPSHTSSHEEIQQWFDTRKKEFEETKDIPIIVTSDFLSCDYKN